jgi:hypothetical protein
MMCLALVFRANPDLLVATLIPSQIPARASRIALGCYSPSVFPVFRSTKCIRRRPRQAAGPAAIAKALGIGRASVYRVLEAGTT